jgi:hypothetical protein
LGELGRGTAGEPSGMSEPQLSGLRNMRVLLEEARLLARDLAYHRRARLEAVLGRALEEVDRQIEELRADRLGQGRISGACRAPAPRRRAMPARGRNTFAWYYAESVPGVPDRGLANFRDLPGAKFAERPLHEVG